MKELFVYTDGGARGNPGPAAIGVVIKNSQGRTLKAFGRYVGKTTNNQAEYRALIAALEEAKKMRGEVIQCHLDSELVVKQMRQEYRVKDKDLQPLFIKAWNLAVAFRKVAFRHIPREQNRQADKLVNEALDKQTS